MKSICALSLVVVGIAIGISQPAFGFSQSSVSVGLGYFSQNAFYEVSAAQSGKPGVLGESSYPLLLGYDFEAFDGWFLAPQLGYSLTPRFSAGKTAKVTTTFLKFPIGTDLMKEGDWTWDWSAGLGVIQYQIKGVGGTVVMNNGLSTATFARPSRTSTARKLSLNLGTSLAYQNSRVAVEVMVEGAFSSRERTQDLMISYVYLFGGSR